MESSIYKEQFGWLAGLFFLWQWIFMYVCICCLENYSL